MRISPHHQIEKREGLALGTRSDKMTAAVRRRICCDLAAIEAALKARRQAGGLQDLEDAPNPPSWVAPVERRRHGRVGYPPHRSPRFDLAGRSLVVLDLSCAGMRLKADAPCGRSNLVRGVIAFADQPPIRVVGKVLRHHGREMGVRLLTRIARQVIDRERRLLRE